MGQLRRPLVPDGPIRTFYERLHALHTAMGQPSMRELQRRTRSARRPNGINPTTIHDAFCAPRMSRWEVVREIVRQLGGDVDEFAELWQRAHEAALHAPARTAATPAEQPAVVVPAQLPAPTIGFTGRGDALKRLDELVPDRELSATPPVAVITGMPGVGKTSLAIHWGHQVRRHFPDGQLFLNLRGYAENAPMPAAEALSYLLRGFGTAAGQIPTDLDDAVALYRSRLADSRVLLVLDNAATAEQVRPLLPAGPLCLVLVTSRDQLSGLVAREGAHRLDLDVFSEAEATALLAVVLGEERVAAEPEPTRALARACGYLPLALRIAAENLGRHRGRGVAEQVAALLEGDRLDTLEIDGDEQTGVRRAFDLSYRALGQVERELFRLIGLIPGRDFTKDVAAVLAGAAADEVAAPLRRLVRDHLVGHDAPDRYSLHDLVRRYAEERADKDEPEPRRRAAAQRLFDHYLYTADAAGQLLYPEKSPLRLPLPAPAPGTVAATFPDPPAALSWLDAELDNLLAAVRHCATRGPWNIAWLLVDTLHGYLWMRHHQAGWAEAARAALAAAEAAGDLRAQAAMLIGLTDAESDRTPRHQAIPHFSRALALCQESGWVPGEHAVLGKLGGAHLDSGHLPEAASYLSRGLALCERTGAGYRAAVLLGLLGRVHAQQGRLEQAIDAFRQARDRFRDHGGRQGEAAALDALGETLHACGRSAEALEHLTEALAIERDIGDRGTEMLTYRNLAVLYADTGELDRASSLADELGTLADKVNDRRAAAHALRTVADVARRRGDHQTAAEHYRRTLPMMRAGGYPYPEAETLVGLAEAYQGLGDITQARQEAQRAHDLASRVGYARLQHRAATILDQLQDHDHG